MDDRILRRGGLFVVEGPDGVGKTTLAKMVAKRLHEQSVPCTELSFPGRESGTLGHLVYELHHSSESLGVRDIHPLSLQTLHVAAHVDALERIIRPALDARRIVILDRYWWSTSVYGRHARLEEHLLRALLAFEVACWQHVSPRCVFLVHRQFNADWMRPNVHAELGELYEQLARDERDKYSIAHILNDGTIDDACDDIVDVICRGAR